MAFWYSYTYPASVPKGFRRFPNVQDNENADELAREGLAMDFVGPERLSH
jgi:hypothetical protein